MSRLPDHVDLLMRKARECDPERQIDFILGAFMGLPKWHFLGDASGPDVRPAIVEAEGMECVVVLSGLDRLDETVGLASGVVKRPPSISMPAAAALAWCAERSLGLLLNPGEDAALIPADRVRAFYAEWRSRDGAKASGFWIPNLTSAEEDFWQELGL